jgi:hypothetical protein
MLRIKSTFYLTGQANNNDRNSKSKKKINQYWNNRVWVIGFWNLRFVWDLMLEI